MFTRAVCSKQITQLASLVCNNVGIEKRTKRKKRAKEMRTKLVIAIIETLKKQVGNRHKNAKGLQDA